MADFLTHVFLPLTAVYVLKPEVFESPFALLVGGFGLLSDFDKFLGYPGSLHSLITLIPIGLGIIIVEYRRRGDLKWSPLLVALIFSHLVLDFVDGGPVPFLYPVVTEGLGLQYPVRVTFGAGVIGIQFRGPFVALGTGSPRPGYNTYGLINGLGVANALLFFTVYVGHRLQR